MKKIRLHKKYIVLITAICILAVALCVSLIIQLKSVALGGVPQGMITVLVIFLIMLPVLLVLFLLALYLRRRKGQ